MRGGDADGFAALFAELQAQNGICKPSDATVFGSVPLAQEAREVIVAEVEDRIVGFALTSFEANSHGAGRSYLNELFVTRAFRGLGIGTLLADHVGHASLARGLGWVRFGYAAGHSRHALLSQEPGVLAKTIAPDFLFPDSARSRLR